MSGKKKQEQDDIDRWPEGVGAIIGSGAGAAHMLDRFARNMQWRGVRVDSASFKKLSASEQLYQFSRAYLHSGIVLCKHAGDTGISLGWSQASVCYHCLHQATELFLKACILHLGRNLGKLSGSHDIALLRKEYKRLLPRDAYSFHTLWESSPEDVGKIFGVKVKLNKIDRTPDQLYRYGLDQSGIPSSGKQSFVPGYLFNYMKDLEKKWAKIWAEIQASKDDG